MKNECHLNFCEKLKSYRIKNEVTQKEIAKALGISERGYQNYELGERFPSLQTLIKIANYHKVPFRNFTFDFPDYFFEHLPAELLSVDKEAESIALAFSVTKNDVLSYALLSVSINLDSSLNNDCFNIRLTD